MENNLNNNQQTTNSITGGALELTDVPPIPSKADGGIGKPRVRNFTDDGLSGVYTASFGGQEKRQGQVIRHGRTLSSHQAVSKFDNSQSGAKTSGLTTVYPNPAPKRANFGAVHSTPESQKVFSDTVNASPVYARENANTRQMGDNSSLYKNVEDANKGFNIFKQDAGAYGVKDAESYHSTSKNRQDSDPRRRSASKTPKTQTEHEPFSVRKKALEERLNPNPLDGIPYSDDMAKDNIIAQRLLTRKARKVSGEEIKVTYLGGVGEIGKNMTAIEYRGQIVVIDCGVMFPSEDMPGIDLVIPDTTYLKENADKVVAFLITHGHEDHIGAVAYVLKDYPKASVYSSRLTLALIENKLREHNVKNISLRVAQAREPYKIGNFVVEFIDVNHSIAEAFAIKITTPAGTIFHSGDFKIDYRPIDGKMIDLTRMAEIGEEGVDLFMCESTNVERSGYTISESDVGAKIEEIFKDSIGRRVFVATFSSNIYRVQQIINLAIKYGRRVATVGRSIENNLDAAAKVGKLAFPKSVFVDIDKVGNLPDGEVLIICTGAQGEPASALSRIANGEFQKVEIGDNDTVILSSSPIPGNESMVNRVINNLCHKGAIVIHENVHASGHACQEELKTVHSLIKPLNFVPVHGEYRHLKRHAELAESLGTPAENILVVENGNTIILQNGKIRRGADVKSGEVLIDGMGSGDLASSVLRDRKQLGEDGVAIVSIVMNKQTKALLGYPVIITRGLVYMEEAEILNAEIQRLVIEAIAGITNLPKFDIEEAKNLVRRPIRAFFNKKMGRTPVILPIFQLV